MITDDPDVQKIGFEICEEDVIRGENFTILINEPEGYSCMVKGISNNRDPQIAIMNTITELSKWKDGLTRDIEKLKKLLIVEHRKKFEKGGGE